MNLLKIFKFKKEPAAKMDLNPPQEVVVGKQVIDEPNPNPEVIVPAQLDMAQHIQGAVIGGEVVNEMIAHPVMGLNLNDGHGPMVHGLNNIPQLIGNINHPILHAWKQPEPTETSPFAKGIIKEIVDAPAVWKLSYKKKVAQVYDGTFAKTGFAGISKIEDDMPVGPWAVTFTHIHTGLKIKGTTSRKDTIDSIHYIDGLEFLANMHNPYHDCEQVRLALIQNIIMPIEVERYEAKKAQCLPMIVHFEIKANVQAKP